MTKRALVVLSGGQDSTTILAWAKKHYNEVHAISFVYGQNHAVELVSAKIVAMLADVASHEILDISTFLKATSDLTTGEIAQYDNPEHVPGGVASTFVPLRNQTFLTIAANRLYCLGGGDLVTGVCQTDFSGYPDCRRTFIDSLEDAFNKGTFTGDDQLHPNMVIQTPLMFMTKAESVQLAIDLPEHAYGWLSWSHTAYTGGLPTDTDAASLLRTKGFLEAGVPDPLVLRLHQEGAIEELPETDNYSAALVKKWLPHVILRSDLPKEAQNLLYNAGL